MGLPLQAKDQRLRQRITGGLALLVAAHARLRGAAAPRGLLRRLRSHLAPLAPPGRTPAGRRLSGRRQERRVARAVDPRVPDGGGSHIVATLGPFASHAPISHLSMQLAPSSPWLTAASVQGDLAMWDWRRAVAAVGGGSIEGGNGSNGGGRSAASLGVHSIPSNRGGLSALALHPQAPRLATGSRSQFIKLYDVHSLRAGGEGGGSVRELHTIRYFDGFLGARIGPVTCLAFHPTKVLLAVGATDSVISVYGDKQ